MKNRRFGPCIVAKFGWWADRSIPRLVSIFDNVEPIEVRQEWQRAIASLCLVLAVAARENAVVIAVEP